MAGGSHKKNTFKKIVEPFIAVSNYRLNTPASFFARDAVGDHETMKEFIYSLYFDNHADWNILNFDKDERIGLYFWIAIGMNLDLDGTLKNAYAIGSPKKGYTLEEIWK